MRNSLMAHGGLTEGSRQEGKGREGSRKGKGASFVVTLRNARGPVDNSADVVAAASAESGDGA